MKMCLPYQGVGNVRIYEVVCQCEVTNTSTSFNNQKWLMLVVVEEWVYENVLAFQISFTD